MAELVLESEIRDIVKKNASFKCRQDKKIPAVIYGAGRENINLSLNGKQIASIINNQKLKNSIIDLKIGDDNSLRKVLIKDYQTDPVMNRLLHVDLYEISADKEINVVVPVKLTGKAKGIEMGGLLEQIMRDVEVRCLPANIPESILVDVSSLEVGDNLHLKDVQFPEGIKAVTELKRTVAVITEPEKEKVETEEGVEEAEGTESTESEEKAE